MSGARGKEMTERSYKLPKDKRNVKSEMYAQKHLLRIPTLIYLAFNRVRTTAVELIF